MMDPAVKWVVGKLHDLRSECEAAATRETGVHPSAKDWKRRAAFCRRSILAIEARFHSVGGSDEETF